MAEDHVDLLITNGLVITINPDDQILANTDIAIKDGRIVEIGQRLICQADQTISAEGKVVMPGLVNAHMHETLPRGICEDLPLDRWLVEVCFPLDRSYNFEIMYASALMNQAEMILGGTTTFVDIYRYPAACAEVLLLSGLRGMLAPQIFSDPPLVGETIESAEAFVYDWCGGKRSSRVIAAFGPHAPYSCNPGDLRRITDLAEKYNTPIHTHLDETIWEVNVIRARHGKSPAEYLDSAGLLSSRLSVAHGVHLSQSEITLLKQRGVPVVYNPTSNMKLASGVAPIKALQESGVIVALGTDSNLSNNNLDMWEEMRTGTILQKLYSGDATVLPCRTILRMATMGGATALGLQDEIGSLEPGKKADLIILDLNKPHLWPLLEGDLNNIMEHLVYSTAAADVSHTIVDGRLLMSDRSLLTLDLKEIKEQVDSAAKQLISNAGLRSSKSDNTGVHHDSF